MNATNIQNSRQLSFASSGIRLSLSAIACLTLAVPAQATSEHQQEDTTDKTWLQNYDPTLITPRLRTEFSYQDLNNDLSKYTLETSFLWAKPISKNLEFGIQGLIPIVLDHSDAGTDTYLGHFELRPGIVGRISDSLRYGFALNAKFDTVDSSYVPNSPALTLRPMAGIYWDCSDTLNFGLQGEYNFTPYDEGDYDVSNFELKLSVATKLSTHWSAGLTYKPKWNFIDDTDQHRLVTSASRIFGNDHEYTLSLGVEVPLNDQVLEYKLFTGLTRYF